MDGQTYLKNVATLGLDTDKCIGCGMCEIVCPHRVFRIEDNKAIITDKDSCMECGACALNCPVEAIAVKTGVGCAAAVIKNALPNYRAACDCNCDCKPKDD